MPCACPACACAQYSTPQRCAPPRRSRARRRVACVSAVALPVYIFNALAVSIARAVLGPRGAFPSWMFLILVSCINGCVFYGLFNATYPFSFFLQVQVYSVCAAFGLCAYAVVACASQCVPCVGGFTSFGAWVFLAASAGVAYTQMDEAFAYLGYADSRTAGDGLWHPWVALVLQLLFLANGVIQSVVSTGEAARLFEPVRPASYKGGV
jgi:hypothetical protein